MCFFAEGGGEMKKVAMPVIAIFFLCANVLLPVKASAPKQQPQAICAVVASGGTVAAALPAFAQAVLAGLSFSAEDITPLFVAAGAGASVGEITQMLLLMVGSGVGIGAILGVAA